MTDICSAPGIRRPTLTLAEDVDVTCRQLGDIVLATTHNPLTRTLTQTLPWSYITLQSSVDYSCSYPFDEQVAGAMQADARGLTNADPWLDGIAEELCTYSVEPECSKLVLHMLAFDEEDRPTAAEVLQSAFLRGQ